MATLRWYRHAQEAVVERRRQNWDAGECRPVPRAACNQPDRRSSGGQLGHDGRPVPLKPASAPRQRDGFARPGRRAEVPALPLEGRAAACSRRDAAAPAQRVRAPLAAPVVLREPTVRVPAGAAGHARPARLAEGAGVRAVPVGRRLRGGVTDEVRGPGENRRAAALARVALGRAATRVPARSMAR